MLGTRYRCARHHLAAATFKLETLKSIFSSKNDKPEKEDSKSNSSILEGLEAELASVWIKYGINLFISSKKKHLELFNIKANQEGDKASKKLLLKEDSFEAKIGENVETEDNEKSHIGECLPIKQVLMSEKKFNFDRPQDPEIDALRFESLDLKEVEFIVRCDYIETTEQAKDLFEFVLTWIAKAGDYFNYCEYPVEYVSLMLDLSELHKCYAFFEPELPLRYAIHLKRQTILDSLMSVTNQLDESTYIDAHIEVARELAQVHLDLLNSDLYRLRELKRLALSRLHLNTQTYHLEQKLKMSVEELESHSPNTPLIQPFSSKPSTSRAKF